MYEFMYVLSKGEKKKKCAAPNECHSMRSIILSSIDNSNSANQGMLIKIIKLRRNLKYPLYF